MIYCLTGKIIKKTLDSVVISCGGVGYFVQIPATTGEALPPAGQEGTVYTIMNVTENDVSLYGFAAEEQRDCFKMLTGVTGVGPKAALSILSIMTPEKIALAASSGDHKAFTKAAGVGPKLAQRITLELKDRSARGWPRARASPAMLPPRPPALRPRRPSPRSSAWAMRRRTLPLPWPASTRLSPCRRSSPSRCAVCRACNRRGVPN